MTQEIKINNNNNSTVKTNDNLLNVGTSDEIFDFYKYLLDHDISFNDYADEMRETCKIICSKKGVTFVDLDVESEDNTPTTLNPNLKKTTETDFDDIDDSDNHDEEEDFYDD